MRRTIAALAAGTVVMLAPAAGTTGGSGSQAAQRHPVPRALASNGAIVPMPEIAGLDCPGMALALERIDRSRYRGPQPLPEDHPDRQIFEYEDRLSAAYYRDCILAAHGLENPTPAFSQGFEPR